MAEVSERRYTLESIDSLASDLVHEIPFGSLCIFTGELGAGKTTLVSAMVKAFGGTYQVSSPSYVLQNIYEIPGNRTIEHWDLYRVRGCPEEVLLAPDGGTVKLVEWGEKFPELLDLSDIRYELFFDPPSDNARRLKITKKH